MASTGNLTGGGAELQPESSDHQARWLLAAWLVCLPLLLLMAGSGSCIRTQEARVLESAWEMTQRGQSWLLPQSNGVLRLQKPPIPYWMSAVGFLIGGVNEWSGRIPTVLVTWLGLGLTAMAARRLFGGRTALLTLGFLLTTYQTFRFGRLAETDAPVGLAVTGAIWAFWHASECSTDKRRAAAWYWLAGACVGLALMTKGGPAVFPLLFLAGWSAVNRTWRYVLDFLKSGGWLAILVIGLPWYVYLAWVKDLHTIWYELNVVTAGEDHGLPFYATGYLLLQAVAPWCAIVIAGLVELVRQTVFTVKVLPQEPAANIATDTVLGARPPVISYLRQRGPDSCVMFDRRLMFLSMWILSILLPLTLIGNKQIHYLVPLMPPLMIACGWIVDAAFRKSSPERVRKIVPFLLLATVAASIAAGPALLVLAHNDVGHLDAFDWTLGAGVFAGVVISLLVTWRWGILRGLIPYMLTLSLLLANLFGMWGSRLSGTEVRDVGRELVARYGAGPYFFWNKSPDLSTVFALRTLCPGQLDERLLNDWLAANPGGLVLFSSHAESSASQGKFAMPPDFLVQVDTIGEGHNRISVYAAKKDATTQAVIADPASAHP